jgi:hypothetical protein
LSRTLFDRIRTHQLNTQKGAGTAGTIPGLSYKAWNFILIHLRFQDNKEYFNKEYFKIIRDFDAAILHITHPIDSGQPTELESY